MVEQVVELDAGNPAVPMGSAIKPSYDFGMFKKVTWDLSPLRRRYLEEKYDLSQKRVDNLLKYNLTQALRNDLLETVDRPRTVDMNAVGSKGGGKSTFLLKCQEEHYRYLYKVASTEALDTSDVSYIIERVFFIQDYLIRYVRQSPKLNTTCLQLDERAYTLGDSSFANLKRITNLTETLRKRKINFFYASPKIRWNFEYEYVIEPLEINERYKILHSAIFDKDMRLLGSLYTRKCDDRLEEAYNKVKEEFMTAVSEGKLRTMEYEEMAREILAAYPDLEELYMDEMRYRVEMERYQGLDAKSRRTYGKPIPPMDKMTKEKMIYYINKVNADYTGTEKMMIMEEVKQILSQKRKEGLAKMADETAKAVLEDTVSKEETGNKDSGRSGVIKEVMGNLGGGSVIELDEQDEKQSEDDLDVS